MNNKYWKLLLLPSLIGFIAFHIIPFVSSFIYAWQDNAFKREFCGFDNFIELVESEYFLLGMKNSLLFTLICVVLVLIISYAAAFLLAYIVKEIKIIRSCVLLPYLLPSITIAAIWQSVAGDVPPFTSLVLIFLWKYTGLNIILFLSSFLTVPQEVLDAAQIDGASPFQAMTAILIPSSFPIIVFSGILSLVNSLKIYRESFLLWGEYPDRSVYMLQNYLNNHFDKLNYQNVSAAAAAFFFGIFIIAAILLWYEKRWSDSIC